MLVPFALVLAATAIKSATSSKGKMANCESSGAEGVGVGDDAVLIDDNGVGFVEAEVKTAPSGKLSV